MSDPLEGIKLKVERANRQIKEIEQIVIRFLADNPRALVIEDDAAKGKRLYKIKAFKKPPVEISVIAGEVLYHLRSALDQLVECACIKRGRAELFRSGFVIERTEKEFKTTIGKRKIEQIFPDLANLLISLKPYKRGCDALWLIHILNSADKHKVLVTTAGINRPGNIKLIGRPSEGGGFTQLFYVANDWHSLDKDSVIFTGPLGLHMEGDIQILTDISLSEVESIKHEPIVITLQQLSDATREIIGIFEARFFGS